MEVSEGNTAWSNGMIGKCCDGECKPFICLDCKVNTLHIDEYYMVTDELWAAANKKKRGMLCIGCLEARLGRELTAEDFPPLPINRGVFYMSDRLKARISTSNGASRERVQITI